MRRFGRFELDLDRYRLTERGRPVAVEPKVLDLLAFLIDHRDRVVSKAELLREIWPGQFVGDSVLTRAVYEARKALGESSKAPRHIETVHRRGYRFHGPLDSIAVEPTPGITAEKGATSGSWRRSGRLASATVLLLGLIGAVVSAHRLLEQRSAPTIVEVLTLHPFEAEDGDPQAAFVALSITDLLFSRLSEQPGVAVRLLDIDSEHPRASGGRFVLRGSTRLAAEPSRVAVFAELRERTPDGGLRVTPLGRFELPSLATAEDTTTFRKVRDLVLSGVLERLAPALRPIDSVAGPSPDPEAYRLYLKAIQRMSANACDGGAAADLLVAATERDPEFSLAWNRLAWAHYNQIWACGASYERYQITLDVAAKAVRNAPSLPSPRIAVLVELGRAEDAYAELISIPEHRRPALSEFTLAYVLRFSGFLHEARRWIDLGLERAPLHFASGISGEVPNTLLYQGDIDDYLRMVSALGSAYHRFYRGLAHYVDGNLDAARRVLAPALRTGPYGLFGRLSNILLAVANGDHGSARVALHSLAAERQQLGVRDGEMTYKLAQLSVQAGDREKAIDLFALAVEQGFFAAPYFETDPLLDAIRDDPRFAATLAVATQRHLAFGRRFGLESPLP